MRYQDMPEDERALEFPARFPVKAMGKADQDIRQALIDVLNACNTKFQSYDISENTSSSGKYTSITVYITAESRKQLDDIYEGLQDRPEIVMTL
jgi:hypothetical protein